MRLAYWTRGTERSGTDTIEPSKGNRRVRQKRTESRRALVSFLLQPWTMVVQPEQLDDGFDVPVAFHVIGDPARLRVQVVQRRLAVRHELFANADRKRQIRQALSV